MARGTTLLLCLFLAVSAMASGPIDTHSGSVLDVTTGPNSRQVTIPNGNGLWNGHDFVLNIMLDNGYASNVEYMVALVESYGGTLGIDISYNYADTMNNGGSGFVTPQDLLAYHQDGHGVHPQGMFKPWCSQTTDAGNTITYGSQWDHGYASFTDADSMLYDMNRDSLATLILAPSADIKSVSYPYGYSVGANYLAAADAGYSWGRAGRVYWWGGEWGFIDDGWYSGFPDTPVMLPPELPDGERVNKFYIGGRANTDSIFGSGESLTQEQVEALVEERLVQPAIADGSYNMTLLIHGEAYQERFSWIINYLMTTYDVWLTDFDTMMEWWAPRNLLYAAPPPAGISAQGSQLAGIDAADEVWWQRSEPPTATACYVFSDGSTRSPTIDGGLTPTYQTTSCATLEVRPSNPTNTYSNAESRWGQYPLPVDTASGSLEALTSLHFDCSSTLSGKTVTKAQLIFHTGWSPSTPQRVHPDTQTGRKYLVIVGATDPDFCNWTAYGTGASSYTNIEQSTSTPWPSALSAYDEYEDYGTPVRLPYGTYEAETDYIVDVTDIVQGWADGADEGGFIFCGTSLSYWVISSHANTAAGERPQLVVYTED